MDLRTYPQTSQRATKQNHHHQRKAGHLRQNSRRKETSPSLEKELHRQFERESVNKINPRKEFFKTTLAEIKQTVEQHNLSDVHWTLKAEAAEYRESLAIEKEQQAAAVA